MILRSFWREGGAEARGGGEGAGRERKGSDATLNDRSCSQPSAHVAHLSSFKQGQRIFAIVLKHHTPNPTQKTLWSNNPSEMRTPAETRSSAGVWRDLLTHQLPLEEGVSEQHSPVQGRPPGPAPWTLSFSSVLPSGRSWGLSSPAAVVGDPAHSGSRNFSFDSV